MSRFGDVARTAVVPVGLGLSVGVLVAAGRGDLATPPVGSAAALSAWLDRTDTVTATLAIVRLLGLVVAGWLLVASSIAAAARIAGRVRLAAVADRALPIALRRLSSGAGAASVVVLTGLGLVAGSDGALAREPVASIPTQGDEGTATMSVLPDEEPTSEPTAPATTAPTSEPAAPEEPAAEATEPTTSVPRTPASPAPPAPPATEPAATVPTAPDAVPAATTATAPDATQAAATAPTTDATWTVARGDSFWSIAAETLADSWGRPPTDAEIEPYWRAVIAANRDRLVSGNADLIYAGQVFSLPPA